ncbi:MAG: MarR family transcriptional regulator [Parerythrobacter sp.]
MSFEGAAEGAQHPAEPLTALPCFLLYVGWRKAQALYRPLLEGQNPQRLYLFHLLRENGSMGVSEIAKALELKLAGASGLISRMEEQGFIQRERSERHHLEKLCSLTPLGLKTFAELSSRIETVDRQLLGRMYPSDLAALENVVRQVKALASDRAD